MPPPGQIEKELGERRIAHFAPASLVFAEEIPMEHFPGGQLDDKRTKRTKRAEYIRDIVCRNYSII